MGTAHDARSNRQAKEQGFQYPADYPGVASKQIKVKQAGW
jgi:hypothetical protein